MFTIVPVIHSSFIWWFATTTFLTVFIHKVGQTKLLKKLCLEIFWQSWSEYSPSLFPSIKWKGWKQWQTVFLKFKINVKYDYMLYIDLLRERPITVCMYFKINHVGKFDKIKYSLPSLRNSVLHSQGFLGSLVFLNTGTSIKQGLFASRHIWIFKFTRYFCSVVKSSILYLKLKTHRNVLSLCEFDFLRLACLFFLGGGDYQLQNLT